MRLRPHPFWFGFSVMASGAGLMADWRAQFGSALDLLTPFLKPTTEQGRSYPCTADPACECRHAIVLTESGLAAVCTCEENECDPIELDAREILVHSVDRVRLGEKIRIALRV